MPHSPREQLRLLPSVDRLLGSEALSALAEDVGVESVTHAAREAIDAARGAILGGRDRQRAQH